MSYTNTNILQTMPHEQTWNISSYLALLIPAFISIIIPVSGKSLLFKGEKHISLCSIRNGSITVFLGKEYIISLLTLTLK